MLQVTPPGMIDFFPLQEKDIFDAKFVPVHLLKLSLPSKLSEFSIATKLDRLYLDDLSVSSDTTLKQGVILDHDQVHQLLNCATEDELTLAENSMTEDQRLSRSDSQSELQDDRTPSKESLPSLHMELASTATLAHATLDRLDGDFDDSSVTTDNIQSFSGENDFFHMLIPEQKTVSESKMVNGYVTSEKYQESHDHKNEDFILDLDDDEITPEASDETKECTTRDYMQRSELHLNMQQQNRNDNDSYVLWD